MEDIEKNIDVDFENKENVIEWITGDKFIYVTFSQQKYRNKLKKICDGTDDAEILSENPDGSIYARLPINWVAVRKPKKRELTEEQKVALAERMSRARNARLDNSDDDEEEDDE